MNILSNNLIAALAIVATPWLAAPASAAPIASPLVLKNAVAPTTENVQYRRGWRGGGGGAVVLELPAHSLAGRLLGQRSSCRFRIFG